MVAATNHVFLNPTADFQLRTQYDHRSCVLKIAHMIASLFRQVIYWVTNAYHRMTMTHRQYCGQAIEWTPQSQGLVVLLHGLRGDPAAWHSQLSLLDTHEQIDVFAPVVPNRGMCSLNDAAEPILPTLMDYIEENPQATICLLGVSNGTRIATWLETRLRQDAPQTRVMVSSIAGVHLGSSRMNLLERFGLAGYFYPQVLQEELKYQSPTAVDLLAQVSNPLPANCAPRKYELYATTEDLSVPDLDSSLPQINQGEHFHVVHGHSHDSIVSAVASQQIASCIEWIQNRA